MGGRAFVEVAGALGVPAGFALGFVPALLASELAEGLGGPALVAAVLRTLAVLALVGALAWLAFRQRGTPWAPSCVALAIAVPSWLVFLGDAVGAPGLALAMSWAGLAVFRTVTERVAIALGGVVAVFMSPVADGQWALAVLALALIGAASAPARVRRLAAPVGAVVAMGVSVWFEWPEAFTQAGRGDLWVLGLMAAACIGVAVAAVAPHPAPLDAKPSP